MKKKIEYLVFKRLLPILVIVSGIYIFFKKFQGNIAETISIEMIGFLLVAFGIYLISDEIDIIGVYRILMRLFFIIFIIMLFYFIKSIFNMKWLNMIYFYLAYSASGAAAMIFRILVGIKETTLS